MKAADFDYLRPSSLAEALTCLSQNVGVAQPLAGGQSLMPMMNFRVATPEVLIDLADIPDLRGVTELDGMLRIGAMTTYRDLTRITDRVPLLGLALPHIAHDAIRNRGTIGGSVALADPAAEMPALLLALGGVIELAGPDGQREVAADDFFQGYYATDRAEDELIVAIRLAVAKPGDSFGFYELTQRHGDYALAGVAIAHAPDLRIAFFGISDRPIRLPELEAALTAGTDPGPALDQIEFEGDLKASAATRRHYARVVLDRALAGMTS